MRKGLLQEWGRAMMATSVLACLKFSGVTATISAAALAYANASIISQNFQDSPIQFMLILLQYSILTAVVIVVLGLIFKVVTYGIGRALIKLDEFIYSEKPASVGFMGESVRLGERTEFYIDVQNYSISSIENVGVSILQQSRLEDGNYMAFGSFIKWSQQNARDSSVSIRGWGTKRLHFATMDEQHHFLIHTKTGSILVSPETNGHRFSLTAYVTIPKTGKQKSKDFDVFITFNENNWAWLKIKKARGEKRYYLEG